jgi:acyl carrier protein
VPGELYIGGTGLARGYFGDEERTRKSFITHPATGERLYRTGDLGRYLPDGILEFLGREDGQVKVQGNRVELGEIESALALHPAVKGAVVVARGPRDGAKRLIAYWVPAGAGADGAADLRAHLARKLPAYMVPSLFVECAAFPLSANGKVDRAALPEPEPAATPASRAAAAAPRDPVEEKLAELGADLLGVPIGRDESFFTLGGNSLTAIRLIARLRDLFHVELPVARFFDAQTVERLAGALLRCQIEEQGDEAVEALLDEIERLPEESVDIALRRELGLLGWAGQVAAAL